MNKVSKFLQNLIVFTYVLFLTVKMTGNVIPINLYLISGASLALSILYFFIQLKTIDFRFNKNLALIILFLLLCFISMIWTRAPIYGLQKLFILSSIVIISFLLQNLIIFKLNLFLKVLTFFSFLILIWYFSENGFGSVAIQNPGKRLDLKQGINPITIARYFCFSLISIVFYLRFVGNNPFLKTIGYLMIGLFIVLTFLTGSKGPLVALFLAFAFFYFVSNGFKIKLSLKYIPLLILILGIGLYFVVPLISGNEKSNLSSFIKKRYVGEEAEGSFSSRLEMIGVATKEISNSDFSSIIFGHGLGDYGFLWSGGFDISTYPHNIFVEIFYETGIIGFILFCAIVINIIRINFRLRHYLFLKDKNIFFIRYLLIVLYFSFFAAMFSGDISGNFFIFVSAGFIFALYWKLIKEKKLLQILNN